MLKCSYAYVERVDLGIFKEKMYKPHTAKIDFYYMNIAAFLIFGAFSVWIFLGHLGSGGKYFLLTNFSSSTTGTVTKIQSRKNPSTNTWGHLAFEEFVSSEYYYKYRDSSGVSHENSIWLVDDFVENKFAKKGELKLTRKHIYEIGQSEEIKYLEKWPAVFLPLSCLQPLQFDMKVMFGSLVALLGFGLLIFFNIRSLLKFRKTNKNY